MIPRVDQSTVWARVAIVAAIGAYALALVVVPARFMTTDAAKYVGIGRNFLTGHGPITAFDHFFPYHSPAWPALVMAPEVALGVDWEPWSRLLNIAGAVGVLVIVAILAARSGPSAAILAVAAFATFRYQFELARTLGLDEAAALSTLLFVLAALRSPGRTASPWGVLLGVTFGVAFLIKEIVLPFAPLPIITVLLAGVGWRVALRLLGTFALTAFAITAWWFIVFASYTGTVYRLETPAWTLVPIAVAIVTLFVLGRLAGEEQTPPSSPGVASARWTPVLAWGAAIAWSLLLAVFFDRSQHTSGVSLLDLKQWRFYAGTWAYDLAPLVSLAGIGALVALAARMRGRLDEDAAWHTDGLAAATILGVPLVLLVVAVGETPRHFIPQLAVLVALGADGWQRLLRWAVGIVSSWRPAAAAASWLTPAVLVVVLVGSGVVGVRAVQQDVRSPATASQGQAALVATVGNWLAANVQPGETVVLGSLMSYAITTGAKPGLRFRNLREYQNVLPQPGDPLGVGQVNRPDSDDWVALSDDPHDDTSFYGYRGSVLVQQLKALGADVWFEGGAVPEGTQPPILAAAAEATGVRPLMTWTWPYRRGEVLRLTAFRIDQAALDWPGRGVYLASETLERLLRSLEAAGPSRSEAAAAALLARVVLVDADRPDLMARLRALAGTSSTRLQARAAMGERFVIEAERPIEDSTWVLFLLARR